MNIIIDAVEIKQRLINALYQTALGNEQGMANQLICYTLPGDNTGLARAITRVDEMSTSRINKWNITIVLLDLSNELSNVTNNNNDLEYKYMSTNNHIVVSTKNTYVHQDPLLWLRELKENGYHVDSSSERLFKTYSEQIAHEMSVR